MITVITFYASSFDKGMAGIAVGVVIGWTTGSIVSAGFATGSTLTGSTKVGLVVGSGLIYAGFVTTVTV